MKTKISTVVFLQFFLFSILSAQVKQEWVSRYDGLQVGGEDLANAIAVDGSGNVYVTGMSRGLQSGGTDRDFATIKYNAAGDTVWTRRYNGPQNGQDWAYAIAVDASSNVFVTGSSGIGPNKENIDYFTIKYNSAGDTVWTRRYSGPGKSDGDSTDIAYAIAVDISGNVYVTGQSKDSSSGDDCVTIKYNSAGVQQWVARYDGPVSDGDYADAVAVDGSGNVYVTGGSMSTTEHDYATYATIKYNANGVQQWVQRYNGPGNGHDGAYSMVLDGSGNVYVTGISRGTRSDDYCTIKYNPAGDTVWTQRYDGPGDSTDIAYAIAVDASGNVYVTGESMVNHGRDYTTIKYNSSGVQQWISKYNGPGNPSQWTVRSSALAIDALGNTYVTAYSWGGGTDTNSAVIKYNSAGVQQWVQTYNGPGNGFDGLCSIAVDGLGNVYAAGTSLGSGTRADYVTIKYSQTPNGVYQTTSDVPEKYSLSQNYPNPFNPSTTVQYGFPMTSRVRLQIYNILGQQVAELEKGEREAGYHEVQWKANVSSGIYFYRIEATSVDDPTKHFVDTKKMLLLR